MLNNKLIIVDDEAILLQQFKFALSRKGFIVFTATKGEDALNLIKEHDPDLMLLDIHLGEGIQGIDTLKQALTIKPSLKIAMYTGFGKDKDTVDRCLAMGAKEVLSKPITLALLKEKLDKLRDM